MFIAYPILNTVLIEFRQILCVRTFYIPKCILTRLLNNCDSRSWFSLATFNRVYGKSTQVNEIAEIDNCQNYNVASAQHLTFVVVNLSNFDCSRVFACSQVWRNSFTPLNIYFNFLRVITYSSNWNCWVRQLMSR